MRQFLSWAVLLCLCGLPGLAMMVAISENQLVGSSDLVIVGTVVQDDRVAPDSGYLDGKAVIRVDRVLKGAAAGTVTAWHTKPPITPPGIVIMDHGGFELDAGKQAIFFLQRYRTDYVMGFGFQGIRQMNELEHFTQALAAYPYTARITAPVGPFYFGQETPVSITVTNKGAEEIKVTHIMLSGHFYAPRMEPSFTLNIKSFAQGELPFPAAIPAGGEKTFTIPYTMPKPQSWVLLSPDTFFMTPVQIHATITQETALALRGYGGPELTSPWVDTQVGFPPPGMK